MPLPGSVRKRERRAFCLTRVSEIDPVLNTPRKRSEHDPKGQPWPPAAA